MHAPVQVFVDPQTLQCPTHRNPCMAQKPSSIDHPYKRVTAAIRTIQNASGLHRDP
jgi:hypothetical protein